jgi:NAD(P)H dehydrogenase (quinone)
VRVLIVFYSRYGNTARLAEEVAEGARRVDGTEVVVRRVPEIAPEAVIRRDERWRESHRQLSERYEEATLDDLEVADAVIFGSANRYGNMAAELKLFIDRTGPLWVKGALIGKVGAVFTTNSTAHSGKESTLLTMLIPLLHLGFILVGVPPSVPETAVAGSYYGAAATTGPGADRAPSQEELTVARALGERVAEVTARLLRGHHFAGIRA